MALDATEVRVATNGALRIAAVGTAAPTDVTTAFGVGWSDLGYATEDGVTLTPSMDTEDINAWQSAAPVRRIVTGSGLEVGFTLIQSNEETLALYFGATVTGDTIEIPVSPTPLERALAVEWVDAGATYRLVVPRASLSDRGEVTLARGEAVGLEMTFTALPPATGPLAVVILPAAA
jgi:hypothetical protein